MVRCSSFYDNLLETKEVKRTNKFLVSRFAHDFDKSAGQTPLIIDPRIINDNRGYFYESFNMRDFRDATGILDFTPIQDNESYSKNGTIRGFHYQSGEHAQAKLVRVVKGSVWDVVLDIRPESKTFGKFAWILLSAENKRQFYVPKGFAHGFCVVSEDAIFQYKVDNYYNKESEGGYNPKSFDWDKLIDPDGDFVGLFSEKDMYAPYFDSDVYSGEECDDEEKESVQFIVNDVKVDPNGTLTIDADALKYVLDYITTTYSTED